MGVDGLPAGFPGSFDGFRVQWGLEPSVRRNAKSAGRIVKGGVGEGHRFGWWGKGRRTFPAGEAATAPDIARAGLEGAARGCRGGCGGGGRGDGRERKHGFNLVQWLPCEGQRLNSAFRHFPAPVVFFNARRICLQGRNRKYPSRPETDVLKFEHGV